MRVGKYLVAAAAATMAASPTVAAPGNPAASLSVLPSARAGSSIAHRSDLAGGGLIIAIIAAGVVIAGIIVVADNNDTPRSP